MINLIKVLHNIMMDRLYYIGQFFSEHGIMIIGGENHVKKIL
jgi:hypothetical protein